jgi:glyoxylase-like metal-dependent hydrolase (beta-lactamase superfamily II)
MGDVFVTYGFPYIDLSNGGTLSGMINTLDKALVLMNDESKVIPGHGNLCTKADVKVFRDKLADIRDKVSVALKKGKKMEELAGLSITAPYDEEWGKGFIKGKDFVMIAAEDFKKPAKK